MAIFCPVSLKMIEAVDYMDLIALRRTQGENIVSEGATDVELQKALSDTLQKFQNMLDTIPK